MIWRFAEPDRILTVKPSTSGKFKPRDPASFLVHQPQRLLNQVSREARCETNKDYIHLKGSHHWFLKNDIFLNTHRDTVYFSEDSIWYGCTKWLYFLGEILHGGEASISRIALEGRILEWPVSMFNSVFDRKVVRQLDEVSFVVARTKKATRTQVFAHDSSIKINGRLWGQGSYQPERCGSLVGFMQLLESSKLRTPTFKVMELCLEDLI
jgi:hypothetical protein